MLSDHRVRLLSSCVLWAVSCGGGPLEEPPADPNGPAGPVDVCTEIAPTGTLAASVVATRDGVFVEVDTDAALYRRHDARWARVDTTSFPPQGGLAAFPDGRVVRFGASPTCSIEVLAANEEARCVAATGLVSSLHVVDDERAYAGADSDVLVFDGHGWTELRTEHVGAEGASYVYDLWADETSLVLATTTGLFVGVPGKPLGRLPEPPGGPESYLAAVWAFGAEDLWVADNLSVPEGYEGRLVRYHDAQWATIWPLEGAEPSPCCAKSPAIRGIWGSEGEVFFFTDNGIHRYRDGAVETFFDVGCGTDVRVLDLSGASPTEVYATVQAPNSASGDPAIEVLRFDGEAWGPLD